MEAVLLHRNNTVRVMTNDRALLTEAPLPDIKFDTRLGDLPRKLTFPDGTVFETDDHAFIAGIEEPSPGILLHYFEQLHPRLLLFVAAAFIGAWLIYRFVLSGFVAVAVFLTPAPLITAIDESTLQSMDHTLTMPSRLNPKQREDAQAIFQHLLIALPENQKDRDFSLHFRRMRGDAPNAFALPGGTVVLTDALATQFDADVVASVLGHEIGHVVEDHGLRRVYHSLGAFVLISLVAGETGPILEDILLEGNLLLSLSFSREQESAADRFGLRLADAAGYDPGGLADFFIALQKANGGSSRSGWLSTHPANEDRINDIEAYIDGR